MIDIQELVNQAVLKNNQVRGGYRDASKFHVSDAGTCYRKRYFKRLGIKPEFDIPVAALRKMLAGDGGHLQLQSVLGKYGKLFAAEKELETDDVKGHFDAIVAEKQEKTMLEIKTIEKWGMTYIKKDGPKKEHLLQMFTYWAHSRGDYTKLDQATLFYVKREDFEGVQFNYKWSKDILDQVNHEWAPLLQYWREQKIPPCTCHEDYGGKGMQYCRYANEEKTECCSETLITQLKGKEIK